MLTFIMFIATAVFTHIISEYGQGYIAGYGMYKGMIPGWAAAISIIIVTLGLLIDIDKSKKLRKYQMPLYCGILWRVFLVFFDRYGQTIFQLPNSGADSNMFYRNAAIFASTGNAGRGGLFSTLMGTFFSFTGVSQLYGQFILTVFSIVSVIMLVKVLDEIIDDRGYKSKVLVITVVSLLPNYAILSSIFLRESLVSMCISISAYYIVLWMKRHQFLYFIVSFVFVLLGTSFHSGTIAVGLSYILLVFIYDRKYDRIRLSVKNLPVAAILMGIVFFLYLNYGEVLFDKMTNVSSLADVGSTYSEGGSTYAAYVGDSRTPLRMIIYTVPRILYFLFSPFPWQWRGITDIIAFVFSSLFYLYTLYFGIKYLRYVSQGNRRFLLAFLITAFCTAFVFSWGTTNTGTATRHREKMIVIFAVIFAIGYDSKQRLKNVTYSENVL